MVFVPFVVDSDDTHVTVDIHRMQMSEAEQTNHVPPWQTSWTSDYLMDDRFEKYAVVRGEELIALGAYEVQKASLIVHIVYLESQPASNPTIDKRLEGYAMSDRLNSMSDAEWYCRRDPEEERFYSSVYCTNSIICCSKYMLKNVRKRSRSLLCRFNVRTDIKIITSLVC